MTNLYHVLDPEDEVEIVPSVRTEAEEDYDEEGYIPIFVIRRTEGSPFFGSFPFGDNGFPFNFFGDSEERIDGQDTLSDEIIPEIPIIDGFPFNFFGDSEERIDVVDEQDTLSDEIIPDIPIMTSFFDDQSTNVGGVQMDLCGFICNIMKQFDDKLKEIEANIKSIKQDKLQPELNNSTYTEKASNLCLVLSQVPKCFGQVQIFCARPKIYLHIVAVTNILCQTKR